MKPNATTEPTVVFVHGANHDGWCWTIVVGLLADAGIRSHVVDLPFDGVESDTRVVADAVTYAARRGPVLVVAHSYGGLPVSIGAGAADALMYVAARMPRPAESPSALTPSWNTPEFAACIRRSGGAATLAPGAGDVLYNTTPQSLRDLASRRWRPMASSVPTEPIAAPVWLRIPSVYVVCTADRTVSVTAQRDAARDADDALEIDCDHSPFFSAPGTLAGLIEFEVAAMKSRARSLDPALSQDHTRPRSG